MCLKYLRANIYNNLVQYMYPDMFAVKTISHREGGSEGGREGGRGGREGGWGGREGGGKGRWEGRREG